MERTLKNEVTNLTMIKYFEKTLSSNNLINIVTHFKWLKLKFLNNIFSKEKYTVYSIATIFYINYTNYK